MAENDTTVKLHSIPNHVAIIMDGNGRWAKKRGRPRVYGHVRGASKIKPLVRYASDIGIRVLTLYAFSTENWTRPDSELTVLWKLLCKFLVREIDELHAKNVRLKVIGEIHRLNEDVRSVLLPAIDRLQENDGMTLCFAVSYGSRREIAAAVMQMVGSPQWKQLLSIMRADSERPGVPSAGEVEKLIASHLWTADFGKYSDVDFMIRTSGEKRISNFLLWQCAYAEFCFVDTMWPDFEVEDMRRCLVEYQSRQRRFGAISATPIQPQGSKN